MLGLFIINGLIISVISALIIANLNKKEPPLYLSAKLEDNEMPINKASCYLKIVNKLSNNDLENMRFIQTKL